jgi:hypothetical protein
MIGSGARRVGAANATNQDQGGRFVTDLPTPTANRLRRPGWRDTRLLIGLVLVLASVAVGSYVVSRADDRVPVFAAGKPLVPGQPLREGDLVRVEVQLGSQDARYVSATPGLPGDRFVLREVPAGELVPLSAVGGRDQVDVQPLTLSVDAGSASTLQRGARVDVYVNPVDRRASAGSRSYQGPELALRGVSVVGVAKSSSGLGSSGGDRAIQVMAPTDRIKGIIGDVDAGARITVVPVVAADGNAG